MASKDLKELFINLGLIENQAVFFFDKEDGKTFAFPSKEIEKKLNIIKPTAFYIFNNQPYILFFDLVGNSNDEREKEIHKQVWSFDLSPLIFIVKKGDIEIFNAFAYEKKTERLQEINLDQHERNERFSFWNLQSGTTWTWLEENYYKKNKVKERRVNQKLFENIKLVREGLTNRKRKTNLDEDDANILILRLIFIRYLIDREVKLEPDFIQGDTVDKRRKSFSDLIETPKRLNAFFEWLNDKFNGVLFKEVKNKLSKDHAKQLAAVFDGEKPQAGTLFAGGDFYFPIFDFGIIPVEVISGIYESLIDEETRKLHSAVYTPSFLVDYILTNTVDEFFHKQENKNKTECKIFDPATGSGIFLVQAFRRMVDREISLKPEVKISKVRLREIAENNLFGIDINPQALKVACFSIYVAILDYRDPKTILDNFHFPPLMDKNLFVGNFFIADQSYNTIVKSKAIDFILGNPPWQSSKKDQAHTKWLKENKETVGRYEIAQSFLLRSKDFMGLNTIAALIVTSTIFYAVSQTTRKFKEKFLTLFCINSFFDLSPVRRLVFEEKDSPCAIVFYHLSDGKNHDVNIVKHQSVKWNAFLKYYKTLVVEKFDQKEILQKHFRENQWMFKVALYGGTLDYVLLKKLEQNRVKIIDLIDDKVIFKGTGIKANKGKDYADFLIGLPLVESDEINEFYTPLPAQRKVLSKNEVYYESGRKRELFDGSKILIKEQARNESDLVISYSDKTYVYKMGVAGIAAKNDEFIRLLYSYLITELYTYYIFITSCAWGVATRPAIRLDEEYLSFPYVQANNKNQEKLIELANQFLSPYLAYYKTFKLGGPQKDELAFRRINSEIEKLYQIKGYEKDIIDYVLQVSRYQFQENKQDWIVRKVHEDKSALGKYALVFLNEFDRIYPDEYMVVDVYPLNHFIAMNFTFTKSKPNEQIRVITGERIANENKVFNALAKNISISKIAKDLYVQKDIKGFEKNSFYIIKPNEYKCWHRAMAWYDVAEIKEAIQLSELERLQKV